MRVSSFSGLSSKKYLNEVKNDFSNESMLLLHLQLGILRIMPLFIMGKHGGVPILTMFRICRAILPQQKNYSVREMQKLSQKSGLPRSSHKHLLFSHFPYNTFYMERQISSLHVLTNVLIRRSFMAFFFIIGKY